MSSLFLTGIGHSVPLSTFPEEVLERDGLDLPFTPHSRGCCLPKEYITSTQNVDPYEVVPHLTDTPTSLGSAAARMALERAHLTTDSLELLIGSTSTPIETIPTESQRLGKELQVKIPAYDIYSGGADLALQLETMLAWKKSRVPRCALLGSSHIPTSRLNYASGTERFLFGDGASAATVSPEAGMYRVEFAASQIHVQHAHLFTIDLYGHLQCDFQQIEEQCLLPALQSMYEKTKDRVGSDVVFVESQLTPSAHTTLRNGVTASSSGSLTASSKWLSSIEEHGNTLAAGPLLTLSKNHDTLESEQIVIFLSGIGLSTGLIILRREV